MPVYFGDTEPDDVVIYDETTGIVTLANQNCGVFSKEVAAKITSDYELFKQTYEWSDLIYRWMEKRISIPDSL